MIKILMYKEWAEVFKNRLVLFTVIFLPLLLSALPLVILGTMGDVAAMEGTLSDMPSAALAMCGANMGTGECLQVYLLSQFVLMFMLIPLIIPVSIAAYSIVGEKRAHSLEPLLATPITTWALILAKGLAAVLPAVAASWLAFLVFAVGGVILAVSPAVVKAFLQPMWLLAVIAGGPLLAMLSVSIALMVSSRVNDPRVAEQLTGVVVVPVLMLLFGQMTGYLVLERSLVVIFLLALVALDAGLLFLTVRVFDRENILTRWK
ncbi:MAG: ABC transporter permease subunit [Anaerolineales bacterium]